MTAHNDLKQHSNMLLPLLFLALPLLVYAAPLRIYLLVGQSNMEGKGSMKHLEQLLSNDLTKSTYQHYGTPENYSSKSNVYIYYQDEGQVHQGPLRVGYGMPINETFGPELEFGWIVGDDAAQQDPSEATDVLLIKCAWGGKSLGVDFRSPSSGVGNYTYCNDGGCYPYHPSFYGQYYRRTIETVQSVLQNLPVVNGNQYEQYELAGLVWFQGWNDVIDDGMVKEYSDNLIHFIRDVRLDLDEPGLPIIVGELGQGGPVPPKHGLPHVALRRQMRLATQSFPLSSTYVMTSPYINAEGNSYNGDYHYYGRADTFFYIGRSFGTAMLQLVETNPPVVRNVTKPRNEQRNEWLKKVNTIVSQGTAPERRRRKAHTLLRTRRKVTGDAN